MESILANRCIVCGNECIREKNQHKFCSRKCLYTFQDKRKTIGCLWCNKKGKWKRRFCSLLCYRKWLIGRPNKSNTKFKKGFIPWNKGMIPTKEWHEKMYKAGFFRPKFGKDSGNWRGGTTKLRTAIMALKKYKEWRISIFGRDNWTCVLCGRRRRKGYRVIIEADHYPKPFYLIIRENRIKTTQEALKCKELWDISNGRTLCTDCHKRTPSHLVNQYSK